MANPNLHENRYKRALALPLAWLLRHLWPKAYLKGQYRYITGHALDLDRPVRYSEKLQYLRYYIYPKWPLVSKVASRDGLREYATECGLSSYLIPCQGLYERFEDIPWSKLTLPVVLKCTHGSGMNAFVNDLSTFDHEKWAKQFHKWLKTDYGKKTLERHYSPIKPQIIIEKRIGNPDHLPIEYKIHVFNGIAKSLYVVTGRGEDIRYTNFYIDWTPFDGSQFNGWRKSETKIARPAAFEEMVAIAERLAKPFPFVRVDLYVIDDHIYLSEMTFTPAKGTLKFDDDQADFEMGAWLAVPPKEDKHHGSK